MGQLGIGNTRRCDFPTEIRGLTNIIQVSCGGPQPGRRRHQRRGDRGKHTGVVTGDGKLYMFGSNLMGELGVGETDRRSINVPTHVKSLADSHVIQVSCGDNHTGVVTRDGKLYMFGYNFSGQLGTGTTSRSDVPTEIVTLTNVTHVDCGADHTGVITRGGRLYMFGENGDGQLGNGTFNNSTVPVEVPSLTNVTRVSCGDRHTEVVTSTGKLYMFGNLSMVGDNSTYSDPLEINLDDDVVSVSCTDTHGGTIDRNGYVNMYGLDFLCKSYNLYRAVMISCGSSYTAVIGYMF
jgi:alpha-tubulin suppressor-like RCC1 family protein